MDLKERLDNLQNQQKQVLDAYESLLNDYNSDAMIHEYSDLKACVINFQKEIVNLREELSEARKAQSELQIALHEQVWNERLNILKISKEKMNTYFREVRNEQKNKLEELEMEIRSRLNEQKERAQRHLMEEKDNYNQRIDDLSRDLDERLKQQEAELQAAQDNIRQEAYGKMDALGEEELDPEVLKARVRQNQFEMKIGLNWINKIGIILIIFGVCATFQYSFTHWMGKRFWIR